jgi:hypothetical protein
MDQIEFANRLSCLFLFFLILTYLSSSEHSAYHTWKKTTAFARESSHLRAHFIARFTQNVPGHLQAVVYGDVC